MAESKEDLGAVFTIPDFWEPSKFLHQLDGDPQAQNPFFSPGLRGNFGP
jgi:hypothetical protein